MNQLFRRTFVGPLTVALAVAAIGGGLAGCKRGGGEDQKKAAAAAETKKKDIATQVGIQPVVRGSIVDTVEVTGPLVAQNDVKVSVKANGKITAVLAREGDSVTRGQVVATQDVVDLSNQLAVQNANLASARTKLSQAEAGYRQAQTNLRLTDEQTVSALKQSKSAVSSAEANVKIIREGARAQERQQADENVKSAKADRDKARSDLKRYQDLYRQQAISAQQLDQTQATADSAEARYNTAIQAKSLTLAGARPEEIQRAEYALDQAKQQQVTAEANRSQVSLRRADIANAKAMVEAAQAGIQQAQASVRIAEQAIRDAEIRSPIDGVVAERKVEPGQQVTTVAADVMRIVDLASIYFDAALSETQFSKVHLGQDVSVSIYALPGRTFKGTVSKFFPVASASRSFTVRISLANEAKLLRPQMFANAKIVSSEKRNILLMPKEAALDAKNFKARVFVDANGIAEERQVTLGTSDLRNYEVLAGLKEGDRLVVIGAAQIQKGDKIEAIKSASAQ